MDEFIGENNVGDQPTDATVTIKGASFTGVSAGGGISAISISGGTVTVATDGAVDSVEIVDPDGTIRVPEIAPVIPIHGGTTPESIPIAGQETISGVTVSDAVFLGRTAGKGGAIYNNGGTLAIFNTFFCDNAAEEGGAIFTQDGGLKIVGGTFRHASDTVRCIGGSSRMTLGGTICTAAQIYAENAIDFAPDTKIDIALGSGTTTTIIIGPRVAFLGNYDTAFANDGNFSLTVTLSAAQAAGKYLLADNAANFDKEVALCVDGTEIGAVTSGKVLTVDDRNYFLSKGNDDNVFLSVGDKIVENAGVVTVDGGTDTIAIGGVIYTGTGYSQVQIGQAFADKQTVAAQDATLSGFTVAGGKNFVGDAVTISGNTTRDHGTIYNNGGTVAVIDSVFSDNKGKFGAAIDNYKNSDQAASLTVTGCTFTGNVAELIGGVIVNRSFCTAVIMGSTFSGNTSGDDGGVIYNDGMAAIEWCVFDGNAAPTRGGAICNEISFVGDTAAMTIRNSVFATATDTIYNNDGMLTLAGKIKTAANIASTNAVTVGSDTELVLDISAYAGTTSKELLSNFNTLFGESQTNLTISIEADAEQLSGKYVLATGVDELLQTDFTITLDGDEEKSFTVSVNSATIYDFKGYALSLNDGELSLSVGETGVVTVDGGTDTVVIEGVTYRGEKYRADEIMQALADNQVVAVKDVSYAQTELFVGQNQTFAADTICLSGYTETVEEIDAALIANNANKVIVTAGTFTENVSVNGGAIAVIDSDLTVIGSVFYKNEGIRGGGAICITETVEHATDRISTIKDCLFIDNTARTFGAIYVTYSDVVISGCTFSGNTAKGPGGAIHTMFANVTIRDCSFMTENDTIFNSVSSDNLTLGGTIWTAANIDASWPILFEKDTQLIFDLSVYDGTMRKAFLNKLIVVLSSNPSQQENMTISLNVGSDQAEGKYLLATGAGNGKVLKQRSFTVMVDGDTQNSFTISIDGTTTYRFKKYALAFINEELVLSVEKFSGETGIVTADGGTDTVVIGGVTYTGNAYDQEQIEQVFAHDAIIAAQDVTLSGFTVSEGQKFVGNNITMADVAAAIYNKEAMILSGTIKTAANITSTKAITVGENTSLVLDFSARTADMGEMLTGYDTMFGESQHNLSITANVTQAQAQSAGAYMLATNASSFDRPIALVIENEFLTSLYVAHSVVFGEKAYRIDRNDGDLQLIFEDVSAGNLFGGGTISSDTVISEGTGVDVREKGSYVAAAGGVYATNCRVTVNNDTSVSVANGYFENIVCAGSVVNANTVLTVNDASRLTVTGGTFASAVAGGSYIQHDGGTVSGGRSSKSNTFVNISGGTFLRDIFGGNIAAKNSFATTTNSYITGSTDITINASENVVSIGGNLVAGSSGLGAIIGSTNLTFTGNADNLIFGTKSIVCGDSHDATTAVSCVGSVGKVSRFLNFDDFTGTLDAKVVGFDQVSLSGGSVTLTKSSRLSDVFVWDFSGGATLMFGDANNDFRGDTLTFGTFDGNEWTVVSGADSTLANWDWADSVTIAGQNASFDEELGYWTSADYKFYKEDNALIVAQKGQIA